MNTKEAILETALLLFNRNGAYAVTTRHIAEEMKISPGNLYYHYSNREEIIRMLMQRMIDEFNMLYNLNKTSPDLFLVPQKTVDVMYRYRFFYMEPAALLERDPLLKKLYFSIKKTREREFKKITDLMTAMGILVTNITKEEFDAAFHNMWALSECIIQSMYMNNEKITEENMNKNFMKILFIAKPYLSGKYRELLFPAK